MGWRQHMDGLYHLFRRRGPETFRSTFSQALLHSTRQSAIVESLLRRRPCLLAAEPWIKAANNGTSNFGVKLANLAIYLPVLLRRADVLCASCVPDQENVVAVLAKLIALENDFQEWLMGFYTLTSAEEVPYHRHSVSQYPRFTELCGGLAHVFPQTIKFPSFVSATSHIYVWICLLVLRRAILDVTQLHPYPLVRPRHQKAALTASIDECAVNLCQSIAYLSQPKHVSCGILACSGPLYFATEWFEEQKAVQRSAWTGQVKQFLEQNSLGGGFDTLHRLDPPLFSYWMLPNRMEDED